METLEGLRGINRAEFDLETRKFRVEYQEQVLSPQDIARAVWQLGKELGRDYRVRPVFSEENSISMASPRHREPQVTEEEPRPAQAAGATQKLQIKIGGMMCSFCAQTIEKAMAGTRGVQEVKVNMAHEEALIQYDPALVSPGRLKEIVRSLGYSVDTDLHVDLERQQQELDKEKRRVLGAAGFSILVLAGMVLKWLDMTLPYQRLMVGAISAVVTLGLGGHILKMAYHSLRRGIFNQHVLLSFGAVGGLTGGVIGLFTDIPNLFGVAVFMVTYHLLNGWISGLVGLKSSQAVRKLLELQPLQARVWRQGREEMVPLEEVLLGETIVVRPGERIPVDGTILEGSGDLDQSLVTGEPLPVVKGPGDQVISGSINLSGLLKVKATGVGEDCFIRQVARYVEESKALKPSLVLLADRLLKVYVPTVMIVAGGSLLVWLLGGWGLQGRELLIKAIYSSVSVLIIGYPCALGMATPMALIRGGGLAAEKGILLRSGEALQEFTQINKLVLDKTGTVTQGKPRVVSVWTAPQVPGIKEFLTYAAAAESGAEHPLAQAIIQHAREHQVEPETPEQFEALAGKGVRARVRAKEVLAGTPRFLEQEGVDIKEALPSLQDIESRGQTAVLLAVGGKLWGFLAVSDTLKEDAMEAVRRIKELGMDPLLITGDNQGTARAIAQKLGISQVMAQVMPDQKAECIRQLQNQGYRVAMVGDGINDAPALMQAHVGIAIGAGTDIAIESSDIILMRNQLMGVVHAYHISRDTYNKIRQNLVLAFLFNGLGIPLAAAGLLHPIMAMAAMLLSVGAIQANSWAFKLRPGTQRAVSYKDGLGLKLPKPEKIS